MRIAILGSLAVEDDGQSIVIGGHRLRALFVRLALDPGKWVTASALLEALWEDADSPGDPLNALQSLVSRLRRLLPQPQLLESSASGYRLRIAPDDVDASRFESYAAQGRSALVRGDPEAAAAALEKAHRLWRGQPFGDLDGATFTQPHSSHLEQLRRTADEDRYEAAVQLGRHAEIVPELEAVVAAEPLREHASALLIRALTAAGRQADALSAYDRTRTALVEELGLDPSPELSAAHQAVLEGAPAPRPTTARTNLPTALTSFVGRTKELEQLKQLLSSHRLITLTGPGGAGKTRLAIAAGQQASDVPAGVWLVELAPVSDPDELAGAALGALSARETNLLEQVPPAGRDAVSRLIDLLNGRRVLLVLDNCEHLVDGAARLAEKLLASCPLLRILATSREPLAIFGEAICPVLPLGMPRDGMTPTQALEFASVRLFADRATAVSPGFSVNDQTVAPVIEICRRLDGLPLAIELAAARLRTLPVDVVAVRLIDRFRLLTGGSRTAVPRHQTLRSVVAWSWELLTSAERHLAEALAVFHGGVTVESAMSVSDVDADSTLELLTALADKSILQPVGQVMRWRMLETLREYGAEQLSLQGRTDSTRAAHAAYFCTLAEQAEPRLRGHEQMEYVRILGAERDNLSAAMRFSVDRADVRTAVRFAAALGWYWHLVGGEAEAAGWCSQILELPGSEQEPGFDISVVGWAFAIVGLGEIDQHRARARHFAETAAKGDLTSGHPLLALIEPGLALMLGDEEGAKRAIERHLQHTDPWARASLHLIRGLIAENAGDLPAVRTSSSAALKGFREAGDRWGVAMSLANSASVCVIDGELEEAVKQFREAVDLLRELGSADDISYLLMRCSIAQERNGDQAGASAALREARDLAEQRGSSSLIVMTEFALGQQLYEQDPVAGRQFVVEAIRRTDTAPNVAPQALASMHSALGGINTVEGRFDDALVSLATAWKLAIDSHDMPVVALAGVKIAELACAQAEPALAARLLGAADAIRGAPDQSDPESAALIAKTIAAIGPAAEIELDAGRRMPQKDALILLESQLTRV